VLDELGSAALSASPGELARYEQTIAEVRGHLGETAFASLQAAARAMSLEQIVELGRTAVGDAGDVSVDAETDEGAVLPGTEPRADPLTRREGEVAALVARGLTDRQIAVELVIAEGTVGVHLERIFSKLELRSRAQLAVWVVERRLATSDPE
jgi:DNA-binding NarL/FixJ family response regulator